MPTRHKVVSLFSGCGGLDLGFREHGFEIVYACDNDPAAIDCYARNLDDRVVLRDVTSDAFHQDIQAIGNCDVVLGGFPCQGFSKSGPKRIDDVRNLLYIEMKRAISVLKPTMFVAENVDGIVQNFSGHYLRTIVDDFFQLGYTVAHRIIDAANYDVPQYRRRVFFVGVKTDAEVTFSWPQPTRYAATRNGEFRVSLSPMFWDEPSNDRGPLNPSLTIQDAIGDIVDLDTSIPDHRITNSWPAKYAHVMRSIGEGQKLCNVRHAATSVYTWQIPEVFGSTTQSEQLVLDTIAKHRRHKRYGSTPNGNPISADEIARLSGLDSVHNEINSLLAKGYLKDKMGKYDLLGAMFCSGLFRRPLWSTPSPTVLTNFHNPRYFLHPLRDRPFSLRECARLQGFPDSFEFTSELVDLVAGYRLVGNAVPPPVSRVLAAQVKHLLERYRSSAEAA